MNGIFTYNNKDYEFNFATDISAINKLTFVDYVVGSVVNGEDYNSIVKDLIFDFSIIEVFTNIDTSFINMMDEEGNAIHPMILVEHFLSNTNVVDIVKANMKIGLLEELNRAVDKSIEYRTGIHTNPLNDALTSLINTLEKKVNEIDLSSAMEMANMLSGITDDFTLDKIVDAYINSSANKNDLNNSVKSEK
jgi:uncharacterized protein YjgD (DUF1641 family)